MASGTVQHAVIIQADRRPGGCPRETDKYGGAEQVLVVQKTGEKRALSSILQNVFDAWLTLLGQPLPPINQF